MNSCMVETDVPNEALERLRELMQGQDLVQFATLLSFRASFHKCWSAAVESPEYNKADWRALAKHLYDLLGIEI